MKDIRVTGIDEKGKKQVYTYVRAMEDFDDAVAIAHVMEWAFRERTCDYDENFKPHGMPYKCFDQIISVELV